MTALAAAPASDERFRAALVARAERGEALRFICFWGHSEARPGTVDAACLSQWYPAPFSDGDRQFATAEHWMMYGKAMQFGDRQIAAKILADDRPAVAKKLGREVRGFDEARWQAVRFELIVTGNRKKFGAHPPLRDFLLRTGEQILVEASPTDRIWGIGRAASDPRATDPRAWDGLNLLGFALMAVRTELAAAP